MIISRPMLLTFLIYIIIIISISFIAWKSTVNFEDYILGGRKLGSIVTALSAGASDMSGWLLMGLPGAVLISGLSESWIVIGLAIGAYLNWKLVAEKLLIYTTNNNALTLPDYFTCRFDDKQQILRLTSALIILLFFTIYCASGIVAGARLFETIFGLNYFTSLLLVVTVTIFYTFMGGFLAISWTNTIQAMLMMFALILTPIILVINNGGFLSSIHIIALNNINQLNILHGLNSIAIISLLGWGLGYFGQPHILARFMSANSPSTIRSARRISMLWMILCLGGAFLIGFFGIAFFHQNSNLAPGVLANSEKVFIELTRLLFYPWIAGVFLSAIFTAVMSSLSGQLLVCSSALTQDVYKSFLRKNASPLEMIWVGRIMGLLISIIAIIIAFNPHNRVLGLVSYAWAGLGASFGPVVLLSLRWRRMTRKGALAGMFIGTTTVIVWNQYPYFGIYEIIPGFILASIAIIVVSLLDFHFSLNKKEKFL
ncbi:MAG: sodium/proline symporter PutP [Candidatus Dasytiphilus stammeri]